MAGEFDALKLENQLCFPLYACAKGVVNHYKPFLDELELTYTQYITLLVLWEHESLSVKELGQLLYLDSGTLTPLLKRLEQKGLVKRCRSSEDERVLIVALTGAGEAMREKAVDIPAKVGRCVSLSPKEAAELYALLYKVLGSFKD